MPGQVDAALRLGVGVVDDHEHRRAAGPPAGDEAAARGVAVPGRVAVQQRPDTVTHRRQPQHAQQPVVEVRDLGVGVLGGAAAQVQRGLLPPAGELALVEEAQAG